jgi:hypothetical protein
VAIWAINTEGRRQVMNSYTEKLGDTNKKVIAAMAGIFVQRVQPQISRLLRHD